MRPRLYSQQEASVTISGILADKHRVEGESKPDDSGNNKELDHGQTQTIDLVLEVREEASFHADSWLDVGNICLFPAAADHYEDFSDVVLRALDYGQFEWKLPLIETLKFSTKEAVDFAENASADQAIKNENRANRAVIEGVEDIIKRLLMLPPVFDPIRVSEMPFKKPITLVTDTCAVIKGGLDFATTFLFPMSRIKIPGVVALEILNMTDSFIALWRSTQSKGTRRVHCLANHIKSQGAQRALMRLEWHSSVEVERPIEHGDPIRSIFISEKDPDLDQLNLKTTQRSLADRLVFETAKEHRIRLNPNHPISVLTSDQGLARMSLAEGMQVLYFGASRELTPFGACLTGSLFQPFSPDIITVSMSSILWEFATCFGRARLRCPDSSFSFEVIAMGTDVPWYPYQSQEDLLWCKWEYTAPRIALIAGPIANDATEIETGSHLPADVPTIIGGPEKEKSIKKFTRKKLKGYRIKPNTFFSLIMSIASRESFTLDEGLKMIGNENERSFRDYASLLESGGFIGRRDGLYLVKPSIGNFSQSIISKNLDEMCRSIRKIECLGEFVDFLKNNGSIIKRHEQIPIRESAINGYLVLLSASGLVASIPNQGIFVTDVVPDAETFLNMAMTAYRKLAIADPFVLTGAWLEELIMSNGVHPIHSKRLLEEAVTLGLLSRYYEGSTPDTRFEGHVIHVVDFKQGTVQVKKVHLYNGGFLSEQRASVRIRLERKLK